MSDEKEHGPAVTVPGSGMTPAPSLNVQATMSRMSEQLQTVIDAAERAADAIRSDAEEQARQHLADAQAKADRLTAQRVSLISELSDDLIKHATTVRDHSEQMVRALGEANVVVGDRLEEAIGGEPFLPPALRPSDPDGEVPPPAAAAAGSGPVPWFVPYPQQESADSQQEPADSAASDQQAPSSEGELEGNGANEPTDLRERALLHGTKLAAAGNERESITEALRNEYGIDDPEPLVDRILGNG